MKKKPQPGRYSLHGITLNVKSMYADHTPRSHKKKRKCSFTQSMTQNQEQNYTTL